MRICEYCGNRYAEKAKHQRFCRTECGELNIQRTAHAVQKDRCKICGYDKYYGALEWHHMVPSEKLFELALNTARTYTLAEILAEKRKCIIVCSNCHREIHAGLLETVEKADEAHKRKQK